MYIYLPMKWITHTWSTIFIFFAESRSFCWQRKLHLNVLGWPWSCQFWVGPQATEGSTAGPSWNTDTLLLGPCDLAEPMTPKTFVATGDVVCSPWPLSKEDSWGFGNKFFPPPVANLLQFLSQKLKTWLRCTQWTFDLNCPFDPKHHKLGFLKPSIIKWQWYTGDRTREVTEGMCALCLWLSWCLLPGLWSLTHNSHMSHVELPWSADWVGWNSSVVYMWFCTTCWH